MPFPRGKVFVHVCRLTDGRRSDLGEGGFERFAAVTTGGEQSGDETLKFRHDKNVKRREGWHIYGIDHHAGILHFDFVSGHAVRRSNLQCLHIQVIVTHRPSVYPSK